MKQTIILLYLLIFNFSLNAQQSDMNIADSAQSYFAIEVNFYNEQSLAFRYRFHKNFYLKIGADISANILDGNSKHKYYKNNNFYDNNNDFYALRLNNQFYMQLLNTDFLNIAFGFGPTFFYQQKIEKSEDTEKNISDIRKDYIFEFGLINSLVSEVKLSKNIFIIFKYDYYILEVKQNDLFETIKETEHSYYSKNIDYLSIYLSTIKLGIGVNF